MAGFFGDGNLITRFLSDNFSNHVQNLWSVPWNCSFMWRYTSTV